MTGAADRVLVNSLQLDGTLVLSPAPWKAARVQPAYLDICLITDTSKAGATDDLKYSTSYSAVANSLRTFLTARNFPDRTLSSYELAEEAAKHLLFAFDEPRLPDTDVVQVKAILPDALLHGGKLQAKITRTRADYQSTQTDLLYSSNNARKDSLSISEYTISTVLGLNPPERIEEQPLIVDIETWPNWDGLQSSHSMAWCAKTLHDVAWKHIRSNHPLLLEKLCPDLSAELCSALRVPRVRTKLEKPKAVMWTSTTAVETVRHRNFFTSRSMSTATSHTKSKTAYCDASSQPQSWQTAYIALGSNLGDRAGYINIALKLLDNPALLSQDMETSVQALAPASTRVVDTSMLYESEPMYVLDQARFLNGACKIETTLSPVDLLALLKRIEHTLGRRKTQANGPREIDLDILLYGENTIVRDDKVDLTIPHSSMLEREFVLRPLSDLHPPPLHPVEGKSVVECLSRLEESGSLERVVPIAGNWPSTLRLSRRSPTAIMSIINVTPDSFSDGGLHNTVNAAVKAAKQHAAEGADILDIGGVSTRPGSSHVTEQEELDRVIPVIQSIREAEIQLPISVDTYRASVARQSIVAGASMINDISGGLHDSEMFGTIAELGCPFVLMHMRGKPEEVNLPKHQQYKHGDVVSGVREELEDTVKKALTAGIRRWNIILDPGIGFSKNADQNLALLRHLPDILGNSIDGSGAARPGGDVQLGAFPMLLGVSRKGFLGKLTGQADASHRDTASSAVHALAIANGVSILRVHNVKAAKEVALVADAIHDKVAHSARKTVRAA